MITKNFFGRICRSTSKGKRFWTPMGRRSIDATAVDPAERYHVQHATDHHVLEARRVRRFVDSLTAAATAAGPQRKKQLDMAGHLMYASHQSYTKDAMLGADECDLLVELVRQRESAGLYGAKITGGGSGGTVAVLSELGDSVDAAIAEIMNVYEQRTGRKPEAFLHSSPGAWQVGTESNAECKMQNAE